jgi:hypothetical protein
MARNASFAKAAPLNLGASPNPEVLGKRANAKEHGQL